MRASPRLISRGRYPFNICLEIILICNDNWSLSDQTSLFNNIHIKTNQIVDQQQLYHLEQREPQILFRQG